MVQIRVPQSGVVYLDTSAIIYSVERIEPYSQRLEPLWDAVFAGKMELNTSVLTLLECLVKPLRIGDRQLQSAYKNLLLDTKGVRVIPMDMELIEVAARLRADLRLEVPDAIHAATALLARVSAFVTNDVDFLRVPGLQTIVLSQLPELNA